MKQVGGDQYERCSVQPWEIINGNGLDYWEGTVLKYLLRHRHKNGKEDLLKLQHFLSYMIEHYGELYVQTSASEWQFPGLSTWDFPNLQRGESSPEEVPEAPVTVASGAIYASPYFVWAGDGY